MARNKEKQFGNLNRLYLLKEQEEYEKANPKRPRLDTLDTVEEVQKWLPSIKRDINFYLMKSEVTCYSDTHIDECHEIVIKLEKEFKAFIRKIHQLSPFPIETTPWTSRPYKRKKSELVEESTSNEFKPIATPILDEKQDSSTVTHLDIGINKDLMDKPLNFSSPKDKIVKVNTSEESLETYLMKPSFCNQDKLPVSGPCESQVRTDKAYLKYDKIIKKANEVVNIVDYDSSEDENS